MAVASLHFEQAKEDQLVAVLIAGPVERNRVDRLPDSKERHREKNTQNEQSRLNGGTKEHDRRNDS